MDAEQTIAEVKRYEAEFVAILCRFKRDRDGVWIGDGDDPILRQYVREIIDVFNEVFGKNNYSIQISAEFDNGIRNLSGSPSYKSVENILSVIRAVLTRLIRNPELLVSKEPTQIGPDQAPVNAVLNICHRFHEVAHQLIQRRESRPTLEIKDEYDVQDLLHALFEFTLTTCELKSGRRPTAAVHLAWTSSSKIMESS
jgi:REase_DpnII-MboI